MNVAEYLEDSPLFKGVKLEDREALIQVMQRRSFPHGTVLFRKGDPGHAMYIILSGRVRIFTQDAQGNELTLRYLSQMFGEFSVLDQQPRSASAAAADDLEVLILQREDFLSFLKERPLVGLSMMRNLAERVRYTTTYLQKVMDATRQLMEGHYDQAVQAIPDSETDAEIQGLLQSFVQMVQGVQAREHTLQQELDSSQTSS